MDRLDLTCFKQKFLTKYEDKKTLTQSKLNGKKFAKNKAPDLHHVWDIIGTHLYIPRWWKYHIKDADGTHTKRQTKYTIN